MSECCDTRKSATHSDKELSAHNSWYQSVVSTTLIRFPLPFIQTLIMSKKMTFAERINAIDVALGNLEGIADTIRNIQNEEIPKLF